MGISQVGEWSEMRMIVDEPVDLDPDCRLKRRLPSFLSLLVILGWD